MHIGVEPLTLGLLSHAAARSDSPAGFEYGCTHQAAETHYLMRQAVELEVAEARALPTAESVIGERHRNREVHAHHADIDSVGEIAGGVAIAGEEMATPLP